MCKECDAIDDFIVICDECFGLLQSKNPDEMVRPEHRETVDALFELVRTPRRPWGEYERALPDGFTACECCDGQGLVGITYSDEEWDAMFGCDDALDHYGE